MGKNNYNIQLELAEYLSELRQKQQVKTSSPDVAIQLKRYLDHIGKLKQFEEFGQFYVIESYPLEEVDVHGEVNGE